MNIQNIILHLVRRLLYFHVRFWSQKYVCERSKNYAKLAVPFRLIVSSFISKERDQPISLGRPPMDDKHSRAQTPHLPNAKHCAASTHTLFYTITMRAQDNGEVRDAAAQIHMGLVIRTMIRPNTTKWKTLSVSKVEGLNFGADCGGMQSTCVNQVVVSGCWETQVVLAQRYALIMACHALNRVSITT